MMTRFRIMTKRMMSRIMMMMTMKRMMTWIRMMMTIINMMTSKRMVTLMKLMTSMRNRISLILYDNNVTLLQISYLTYIYTYRAG